jgi:hypothetical protein
MLKLDNSINCSLFTTCISAFILIVMSHWLGEVCIRIQDITMVLPFISVSFGELCLLVSWCAGDRCDIACSDEDRGRSRRPDAEYREWSYSSGTQWPGDREVRWHCVWSAPYTWRRWMRVSWLSLKTKVNGLSLVWRQNHRDNFLWFDLKTSGDGFLWFDLKTGGSSFPVRTSKLAAMVWWFGS